MSKPNWNPKLKDVLMHETIEITKVSKKTGNEYKTDCISEILVYSTGSVENTADGNFKYAIVDSKKGLEYEIKVPNKIDVKFGSILKFKNLIGGATSTGGWYSADSVAIAERS